VAVQSKPVRAPRPAPTRRRRPADVRPRRPSFSSDAGVHSRQVVSAPPAALPRARPSDDESDRSRPDRGVGLLLIFVAATMVMVVAVAIVAIVDRWWVLVPVMLVDFAVTYALIAMIARLLRDDGEPPA
jgi:hypothetical protein